MYDETYGIICGNYEKILGLNGAFLNLETQYVCRVSDGCIQQIHLKPSATFSDNPTTDYFTPLRMRAG